MWCVHWKALVLFLFFLSSNFVLYMWGRPRNFHPMVSVFRFLLGVGFFLLFLLPYQNKEQKEKCPLQLKFGCPRIIWGCLRWVIVSIPVPYGIENLMDAQPLHQDTGQGLSLALLVHLLKARLLWSWIRAGKYSWYEHGQNRHMTICIN